MHSIPVLYYQSVGDHPYARPLSFVSLPLEIFTAQIEWLVKKKYTFLTLQQLYKYMRWAEIRAMELGYLSTTRGLGFNGPGSDPTAIKRAEVLHKNLFLGFQEIYISARIAQLRESKFRIPLNVKKTINRTG